MESLPHPSESSGEELLPTRPSLLAKLRNHDDSKAWKEFFDLYHPVIYRHAMRSGLRPADAEDVVQEIVVGVANKLPQFRYDPERCSFKTWLFRIARNKIADQFRRQGRQAQFYEVHSEASEAAALEIADPNALSPDKAWDLVFENTLRRAAIEYVTQRVKPMTMRLYLFHVVEGNSVKETVAHFRSSQIKSSEVHLAKHRVQKMVDEALGRMRKGGNLP